mgnify:FL=1
MKPTDKYRELLYKQRAEFEKAFAKLFLSMEVILDNVDQQYEQRRIERDIKKGEYETKEEKRTRSETNK